MFDDKYKDYKLIKLNIISSKPPENLDILLNNKGIFLGVDKYIKTVECSFVYDLSNNSMNIKQTDIYIGVIDKGMNIDFLRINYREGKLDEKYHYKGNVIVKDNELFLLSPIIKILSDYEYFSIINKYTFSNNSSFFDIIPEEKKTRRKKKKELTKIKNEESKVVNLFLK